MHLIGPKLLAEMCKLVHLKKTSPLGTAEESRMLSEDVESRGPLLSELGRGRQRRSLLQLQGTFQPPHWCLFISDFWKRWYTHIDGYSHQLSSQVNTEIRPQICVQCQLKSSFSTALPESTKASDILASAAQKSENECAKSAADLWGTRERSDYSKRENLPKLPRRSKAIKATNPRRNNWNY